MTRVEQRGWKDATVHRQALPSAYNSYFLADNGFFGATQLAFSSASSKTAYGTGPRLVGLTSPANQAFTESLGCYDEVLGYDDDPPTARTAYVDLAGRADLRRRLHEHLQGDLVYNTAVGITHQVATPLGAQQVFFAPDQIRTRIAEWGWAGLDERFVPVVAGWVDVVPHHGPEALRTAPRNGHVITLST